MPRGNLREHYRSKQHQKSLINATLQMRSSTNLSHTTQNDVVHLQEIDPTLNILSEGVSVLDEDRQRLTTESIAQHQKLDTFGKDLTKLKTLVQGQNALLNEITTSQDTAQEDLQSMMTNINQNKTRTHDGAILWRLDHVGRILGWLSKLFLQSQTIGHYLSFMDQPANCKSHNLELVQIEKHSHVSIE